VKAPVARVGDLAIQLRGVTFAKADASEVAAAGLVPILRAGNIADEGLRFDDLVYVPEAKVSERQFLRPGDVVIAASSGSLSVVGKAARVTSPVRASFGAFCKVLRPSEGVDPNYFAHYFRTREYRQRMTAAAEGANINNLRSADLDDLEIRLPSVDEQRRIARVLDAADRLLTLRRTGLARLDALAASHFIAAFGDPDENSHGWPVSPISALVASFEGGKSFAGEDDDDSRARTGSCGSAR
jgi:type I restriction enzyme, S subunit